YPEALLAEIKSLAKQQNLRIWREREHVPLCIGGVGLRLGELPFPGLTFRGSCSHFVPMAERHLNEADTIGLLAELREFCARLARQWSLSEVQLHQLMRDFSRPELSLPQSAPFSSRWSSGTRPRTMLSG